jgi:hypothetical protein
VESPAGIIVITVSIYFTIDFKIRKKPSQGKDCLYQMRNPQAILYLQLFKDSENDKKFSKYPNKKKKDFI